MMLYNPAENLIGKKLENGWVVSKKIEKKEDGSGGNFSVSYIVEKDGDSAFLKAQDLSRVLRAGNVMQALEAMTTAHNYECDLLKICDQKKLSKVVNIITTGEIPAEENTFLPVPYIIFELADRSVRDYLNIVENFNIAWIFRSLHNIAVGLKQLHNANIVHQDIKPSNILLFDNQKTSKLADLGRGELKGKISIYSDLKIAGDPAYAPPEQLYGYLLPDWGARRKACDLFHLGSMIVFYFLQTHMTVLLRRYLPMEYQWTNWDGDFNEVLPFIDSSFEIVLIDIKEVIFKQVDCEIRANEIINIINQLCKPDPAKRGYPKLPDQKGDQYSMEKYITKFDVLARYFEIKLK